MKISIRMWRRNRRLIVTADGAGGVGTGCFHVDRAIATGLANDKLYWAIPASPRILQYHEYALGLLLCNANWSDNGLTGQVSRAGRARLTMYGQMTAGSWIYLALRYIWQGTYEPFAAAGEETFGGDLAGKLLVPRSWEGWVARALAATIIAVSGD